MAANAADDSAPKVKFSPSGRRDDPITRKQAPDNGLKASRRPRAGSRMIESGGDSQAAASQIQGADLMEDAEHEAVFDRFT